MEQEKTDDAYRTMNVYFKEEEKGGDTLYSIVAFCFEGGIEQVDT